MNIMPVVDKFMANVAWLFGWTHYLVLATRIVAAWIYDAVEVFVATTTLPSDCKVAWEDFARTWAWIFWNWVPPALYTMYSCTMAVLWWITLGPVLLLLQSVYTCIEQVEDDQLFALAVLSLPAAILLIGIWLICG